MMEIIGGGTAPSLNLDSFGNLRRNVDLRSVQSFHLAQQEIQFECFIH